MRTAIDRLLDQALGDNPRLAVAAARRLRVEFEWIEQRAVALARREGYDWGRIGRLLGVSRQSARSRFIGMRPTAPPSSRPGAQSPYATDRAELTRSMNRIREDHLYDQLGDGDIVAW
jgi:hypothetical protein